MKLALILMIKNEEKILKRCLEAVENIVDCFCICDTGSTDKTVEIAEEFLKTHTGCVTVEPWKNFGHNRTISFQNAQKFIRDELKWDTKDTYGLLLDADMVFVPGTLKQQNLTATGYRFIQVNGTLEYYNTRLVRMDFPWKCVSVTHEYWDGPSEQLPKEICYIDDRNDGGCKHDKFERDQKLLEQGLIDEPENVRYMFYLAQTYKCLGKHKDAIKMYKKRIAAGGWVEEVWYSMYMIGEAWKALGNISKFEDWMQRAHHFRPQRTESIYKLAEFFRVKGDQYKAYHYTKIGQNTPYPKDDVLFIEGDVYRGKFDYEASILDYYVHQDKKIGLRDSIKYLLKMNNHSHNVISNLKFYTTAISSKITPLNLPTPFGDDFRPTAVSVVEYPYANVRYVNYLPPHDGGYRTRTGEAIMTHNAFINLETKKVITKMNDQSIILPRFNTFVKGVEDIRMYTKEGKYWFTGTSCREYKENTVSIINGEYDNINGEYKNVKVIESPTNSLCEKNWIHIPNTDLTIYSWSPYVIGKIEGSEFKPTLKINTPPLFNFFRGSASPIKIGNDLIALIHFVEYCTPRKYYHCFVKLDSNYYFPTAVSLPFVFKQPSIEFCTSIRLVNDSKIECYASFTDADPSSLIIPISSIEWSEVKTNFIPPSLPSTNPEKCKTTFVTALIDLHEPRPKGKDLSSYLNHFKVLADTGIPLHVYISQSYILEFTKLFGNMSNIYVETKELDELDTVKQLNGVEYTRANVIVENSKQTLAYNKFNNSKVELVYSASKKNVFNNNQFAWIDFGINHVIKNKKTYTNLLNIELYNDQVVIPAIWNKNKDRADDFNHINWRFAGGFFVGNIKAIDNFYKLYTENFKSIISKKKVLPCEASVWAYFEEFYNWDPICYTSDHNDTMLMIPNTANSTIVSMFFDLKKLPDSSDKLRPIEFYLEHGRKTLELPYPMVLFCDEETKPHLEQIRGNRPTTYIEKKITEYDYFKELHPKVIENRKIIPSIDSRNTASYFLTSVFKIYAIHLANEGNFYPNTTHYCWIDLGGSHVMRGFPDSVHKILKNPTPKISCAYIHYRPDTELYPMKEFMKNGGKCCFGSGCFTVQKEYTEKFYKDMFDILREQISIGVGHAEEQCMAYCYSRHPDWFNLYFADYYSLITNYHKTLEDIECVKLHFIENAKKAGRNDLVELALSRM